MRHHTFGFFADTFSHPMFFLSPYPLFALLDLFQEFVTAAHVRLAQFLDERGGKAIRPSDAEFSLPMHLISMMQRIVVQAILFVHLFYPVRDIVNVALDLDKISFTHARHLPLCRRCGDAADHRLTDGLIAAQIGVLDQGRGVGRSTGFLHQDPAVFALDPAPIRELMDHEVSGI